jgi:acid phosphatase
MENKDYADVIGSPFTPYITSLAAQYGLATNYFANTHPSIGNYFMVTTGKIVTNDSAFSGAVADDNLVRRFLASGKTWTVFAEGLPTVGYLDDNAYPYVKRHDPFAYFTDVRGNAAQASNIVPYNQAQFAAALAARTLPQFVYILPNQHSNMHDCLPNNPSCTQDDKLAYGDNWLQQNLTPILADSEFQQSGLLILTFDEASVQDSTHGGGRIMTIIISAHSKRAFQSNTFYQHQSALRLICDEMRLSSCPGAGSTAPRMSEFFN